jgi:tetratricopeptide (TPR) repeat protein
MDNSQSQASTIVEDLRNAIAAVHRGQRCHQHAAEAIRRGQADVATADLDRAIAEYTEAIRLDPRNLTAYLYRARAYEAKGDDESAEADLDTARQLESM